MWNAELITAGRAFQIVILIYDYCYHTSYKLMERNQDQQLEMNPLCRLLQNVGISW